MSNPCDNTLYAYSEDRQNIDTIINFFHDWPYASIEDSDTSVDIYFDSRWVLDRIKPLYIKLYDQKSWEDIQKWFDNKREYDD